MRNDPATSNGDVDNIIVQQELQCSLERKSITVMSSYSWYITMLKLQVSVIMESPIKDRTLKDICETTKVNSKIVHDILSAHGLSGCDTAAIYLGIGKGKIIKVFRAGYNSLAALGVIACNLEDV